MTTAFCQWALMVGWALRLVSGLYQVHTGRKALEPTGFIGTFVTIVFLGLVFVVNWRAGSWSTLIGTP